MRIERFEAFVLAAAGKHLLEQGLEGRTQGAILRARSRNASQSSNDEKRLKDVHRKLERGAENLALAGKQDFAAISRLLTKCREEEAEIAERIERRRRALEPLPEVLAIIRRLGFVKKRLENADHAKRQYALRQTVASIHVGTRMSTFGEVD